MKDPQLTQVLKKTRKKENDNNNNNKALYSKDDVDRLYASRKEGGRGLCNIEDSVDTSIQRFEDHIQKRRGRLITATRNNTYNMRTNRMTINRKQKWEKNNSMDVLSD